MRITHFLPVGRSAWYIAAVLVAAVLLALAGFLLMTSRGDGEPEAAHLQTPCTNEATREAVIAENRLALTPDALGTPQPFRFTDDELECRIRRAVLTADEAGQGWRISDFARWGAEGGTTHVSRDHAGPCGIPWIYLEAGMETLLEQGDRPLLDDDPESPDDAADLDLRLLAESVLVFADGQGPAVFHALRRGCAARPEDANDESPSRVDLAAPALGDEAFAVAHFTGSGGSEPFRQDVLAVRLGDVILHLLLGASNDDANGELLFGLGNRAYARLERHISILDPNRSADATPTPSLSMAQQAMHRALLTAEDNRGVWVEVNDGAGFEPDALLVCDGVEVDLPAPVRTADRLFAGAGFSVNAFAHTIVQYGSADDAESTFTALADRRNFPDGCSGEVLGDPVRWTFTWWDLGVEAEALAWTATSGSPDLGEPPGVANRRFDVAVVHRGELLATIVLMQPARFPFGDKLTREMLAELVEVALPRLHDLGDELD